MRRFISNFLKPTTLKRTGFFIFGDVLIIIASIYCSFLLRFDFSIPLEYRALSAKILALFISVKLLVFTFFRMYKITWRYVGLNDLRNILAAIVVSQMFLVIFVFVPLEPILKFNVKGFPRSVILIDGVLTFLAASAIRISKRLYSEVVFKRNYKNTGKRTVIVGAGNTGEMLLRDMARQGFHDFYPVAMLDDDRLKIGTYVHGIKVSGTIDELKIAVERLKVEAVIIAIPSLNHKILIGIYNAARDAKVNTVKIIPRIYDFHKPEINLKNLEEIKVEDLLGRQTVEIDYKEIEIFLYDRKILITGAGGSIGSEIVMQACAFSPRKIILFDIDETELHNMHMKLKKVYPGLQDRIHYITGDVRDHERIKEVFEFFMPEIVFHAAAYKHVPMMEYNPKEAVKVNMMGTYILAETAANYGVKKFIMISTDKAVRPSSIMGATKRMAEYICKSFNEVSGEKIKQNTEFISVRFGNVLGSRGSVLPLFLQQLKDGGPLTVTHREMRRYFMTIPEAVSLVLQASVIGKGGDVLVLDMGEPVRIIDFAEELIRIHGLEPYKDIDIEFIGLRPAEKLFEEMLTAEEGVSASKHEKVFTAKNIESYSMEEIKNIMTEFEKATLAVEKNEKIKDLLKKYVKHFECTV